MRKRKKITNQLQLKLSLARIAKLQRKLVDIEIALQESHTRSRNAREQKAVESIKSNPKYFFSYAKSHSKLHTEIGPLLREDNTYI